jgi:hypothetical protein
MKTPRKVVGNDVGSRLGSRRPHLFRDLLSGEGMIMRMRCRARRIVTFLMARGTDFAVENEALVPWTLRGIARTQ